MLCARTLSFFGRRLLPSATATVGNTTGNGSNTYNQTALTRTTISHCLQLRQFTKDLIDHPEGTVFKGEDFYGNKYYEAPREDNGKYLKTRRWMEPAQASDVSDEEFDKLPWKEQVKIIEARQDAAVVEVPPEWESWLRGRRPQTPSLQEQARSARIALKARGLFPDHKGSDAASSAASSSTLSSVHSAGKSAEEVRKESVTGLSFPVYEDMEVAAGEELTPEERQRRIRYSKDSAEASENVDDDSEYVPPGARK